jgi:hypothetical protein
MEELNWKINPTTIFELANDIFRYKISEVTENEDIFETFKNYALFAIDGKNNNKF